MVSKILKVATPTILLGILASSVGISWPSLYETPHVAVQTARCSEPCPIGAVLDDVVGQYGASLTGQLSLASKHGPDAVGLSAKELRGLPGVASITRNLTKNPIKMMRETNKNAGLIPDEIAQLLTGQEFSKFDDFREAFWERIAASKYAQEFSQDGRNLTRMQNGYAPFVQAEQATVGQFKYQIHHIQPIHADGSVYDMSNLMVLTPRLHQEVLSRTYHYGN